MRKIKLSTEQVKDVRFVALTIIIVFVVWLLGHYLINLYVSKNYEATCSESMNQIMGTYGDSYGGINALMSALAFGAMIITLRFQYKELALQRKDIASQKQDLNLQRFEHTFFNMLQLWENIVESISFIVYSPTFYTYKGREAIKNIFTYSPPNPKNIFDIGLSKSIGSHGIDGYVKNKNRTILNYYFHYFYSIISYLDKSVLSDIKEDNDKIKLQYANILASTLSRYELVVLFYHGLSSLGEKLKPLLEKYAILNKIDIKLLVQSPDVKQQLLDKYHKDDSGEYILSNGEHVNKLILLSMYEEINDYAAFITDKTGDKSRYHISAFCTTDEERIQALETIKKFQEGLNADML